MSTTFVSDDINVGIGTTSPVCPLHVVSEGDTSTVTIGPTDSLPADVLTVFVPSEQAGITLQPVSGSGISTLSINARAESSGAGAGALNFIVDSGDSLADIQFTTRGANPHTTFKNDGKVGIGTATPAELLEVAGNVQVDGDVVFAGTNTTGAGSALLGANCPAGTVSAPYTWIEIKTADGSTAYIPAWK